MWVGKTKDSGSGGDRKRERELPKQGRQGRGTAQGETKSGPRGTLKSQNSEEGQSAGQELL